MIFVKMTQYKGLRLFLLHPEDKKRCDEFRKFDRDIYLLGDHYENAHHT